MSAGGVTNPLERKSHNAIHMVLRGVTEFLLFPPSAAKALGHEAVAQFQGGGEDFTQVRHSKSNKANVAPRQYCKV